MSNRIQLLSVLFLTAAISNPLRAEVGTQEQAIQAAIENREPEYLKSLAEEITRKLHTIAQKKELNSLHAKIAWILTMRGIINVAFGEARDAAYCRIYNEPFFGRGDLEEEEVIISSRNSVAWEATIATVEALEALDPGACLKAYTDVLYAVGGAAFSGAYVAVGEAIKDVSTKELEGKIAWRVAEWSAQNYFLMNLEAIVNGAHGDGGVFDALLAKLTEIPPKRRLDSEESLFSFLNHYFGSLDQDAMRFLAPWLLQIMPIDSVPQAQQPLFEYLRLILPDRQQDLPVAILGTKIVNSVICSLVQASCTETYF